MPAPLGGASTARGARAPCHRQQQDGTLQSRTVVTLFTKGVSVMPLSYYAARANLYALWQHHPDWSHSQLATALGCSKSWVEKWLKRFREELPAGLPLQQIW